MRPLGRSPHAARGQHTARKCLGPQRGVAFDREVERGLDQMRFADRMGGVLAPIGGPARPQPVGRVDPRRIEPRRDRLAFTGNAAKHGIDELVVARGLGIVLGERHGEVDDRVRRHLQENELRRGGEEDRIERAGFLRHAAFEKGAQHMVELALAPQACRHDRADKSPVACGQIEHEALIERTAQDVVERLPLLEDGGKQRGRGAPCRQPDLGVPRARTCPRFLAGGCHGVCCP